MAIVLFRVDERLIHGQVVLGWGSQVRADRFIVVDDDLVTSEWEQDLYRLGAGDAEALFASIDDARTRLAEWRNDDRRSILLTRDVSSMLRLARGGLLAGEEVNLGGQHHGPGRNEVLTYLHLSDEDRNRLAELTHEDVSVSARDLPDAHKVPLKSLFEA